MPIYLATLVAGQARANTTSIVLGIVVVTFSFVLGGAELAGIDLDRFALAIGVSLFVTVLAIHMAPEVGRTMVLSISKLQETVNSREIAQLNIAPKRGDGGTRIRLIPPQKGATRGVLAGVPNRGGAPYHYLAAFRIEQIRCNRIAFTSCVRTLGSLRYMPPVSWRASVDCVSRVNASVYPFQPRTPKPRNVA